MAEELITNCFGCNAEIAVRTSDDFEKISFIVQAILAHNSVTGHAYFLERDPENIVNKRFIVREKGPGNKIVTQG